MSLHDSTTEPSLPHVVHVARECSEVVSAGGVGDVVLQLALQCVKEGYESTVVLPHYGRFRRDRWKALAARLAGFLPWREPAIRFPPPVRLEVPMAFADQPGRAESATVEAVEFRGPVALRLAAVVAERFAGKQRPYVYTAAEAESIAHAPPHVSTVCGAERPPEDFRVEEGTGHFDYFAMNVLLQKAALLWLAGRQEESVTVHCHDAHTAMVPMLARHLDARLATRSYRYVVTAHNCGTAYRQRAFDLEFVAAVCGVPRAAVDECVIEGEFDPFGAAALHADRLTTVSDGYAWEVQGACLPSSGGDAELRGFSEFLAEHAVEIRGIANGIAAELKGPEAAGQDFGSSDRERGDFSWKPAFRKDFAERVSGSGLEARWGIEPGARHGDLSKVSRESCLFTFVGRWTAQKGVDVIAQASREILGYYPRAALCVLGDGHQPAALAALLGLVRDFPGRAVVVRGFSPSLAASIYKAGDFILVPSRFEPCGLIDMIAQLNGNVPVVNQVGGLAKVVDGETGIGYFATSDRENLRGLVSAMQRAIALLGRRAEHSRMQRNGNREVREKHSWDAVFARYAPLYSAVPGQAEP